MSMKTLIILSIFVVITLSTHILPPEKPVRQGDYLKCLIKQCYRNCGGECQKQQQVVNKCEDESDICISWRSKIRMDISLPEEFFYCKEHCQIKSKTTSVYSEKFKCQIQCAGGSFYESKEEDDIDEEEEKIEDEEEEIEEEEEKIDTEEEKVDENEEKVDDTENIQDHKQFDKDTMTDDNYQPKADSNNEPYDDTDDDKFQIDDQKDIHNDKTNRKNQKIENKKNKQKIREERQQTREERQKQKEIEIETKKKEEAEKNLPWYCKIAQMKDYTKYMC